MKECKLFVQLLSEVKGKCPNELPKGVIEKQFSIAKKQNIDIIQWCDEVLNIDEIEDKEHKELLSTEYINKVYFEKLSPIIIKKLENIETIKNKKEIKYPNKPRLFIDRVYEDKKIEEKLKEHFKTSYVIMNPIDSIKTNEVYANFKENILNCDFYIPIYGEANRFWVENKLSLHRKYGLKNCIILYEALPHHDTKEIEIEYDDFKCYEKVNGTVIESAKKIKEIITQRMDNL